MNRRSINIRTFLSNSSWMIIRKYSKNTYKAKISINKRKIGNIEEFFKLLEFLKKYNLIEFKPIIYSEPINVFDCVLVRISTKEFDQTDYFKIKDLISLSIANKETENNIFILIPLKNLFEKYSLSDLKYFLEDNFQNFEIKRLNNVEVWNKKDAWFYIENIKSSSGKYFFVTKNHIIISRNVKKYPKQLIIRFKGKLFRLISKILLNKSTKETLRKLSKYQYSVYKLLKSLKIIEIIKLYKSKIIKLNQYLEFLFAVFIYSIKHIYNCYLSERKKGTFNSYQEFLNWFIKCWET